MKTTPRYTHRLTFAATTEKAELVLNFKSLFTCFNYILTNDLAPAGVYYDGAKYKILATLTESGVLKYERFDKDGTESAVETSETTEPKVSTSTIRAIVKSEISKLNVATKEITVRINEVTHTVSGPTHYALEEVLMCLAAKTNVMLVGPAGSGKTTVVEKASKALGLEFFAISVGLQTSKVEFMGYNDAMGKYIRTMFREAYENGGVFLIDEIDAGNPGIMTVVNAALANGICAFPDAMVKKHANFICCAAANTYGKGADRMYVGRNQLDAATLDRFVKFEFNYDENMERALATNADFVKLIQRIRAAVEGKKLRVLVTPRATINGCALVAQGMTFYRALELVLFAGCSAEEKNIIMEAANLVESELKEKRA